METKIYTREYFVKMGKIGGRKTKKLYGLKHYSKINPGKQKKENVDMPIDKGVV